MSIKYLSTALISECVSLLRFNHNNGLRILTYHSVGAPAFGDKLGIYNLSVERFLDHLTILEPMKTVPIIPIAPPENQLTIAITFDDGYVNNLYVAAPLLASRNIPFTVFNVASFVKNQKKGFLSPSELKELSKFPGVKIGSHGLTHCNLMLCSNQQLKSELQDSKHYLEDLIGMPVTEVSYPYGLVDMRIRYEAQLAGYKFGGCSRFDINYPGRDRLLMNRCEIRSSDSSRIFKQKLSGDWDWYRWRNKDPQDLGFGN